MAEQHMVERVERVGSKKKGEDTLNTTGHQMMISFVFTS